ncbi:MAG TPA: TetR/AcrR family transcriptional regulator [Jatrophihabitans sp.]|nr:TetR/AcrR family transcriptional regulator [Jatrophihabitans sp.]
MAATRRERLRTETTAEIKEAAWAELQAAGLQDLSLRGVARRLGMAPSALYRYFDSRDALLTEIIIEAYQALGLELQASYRRATATAAPARQVFLTVARAYRDWAMSHRLEYKLIFATTIPGYVGTDETKLAASLSTDVLLQIMADLVREDGLDLAAWRANLTPDLSQRLQQWADMMIDPMPAAALLAALACYASLHGAINIQMYSHLPPMLADNEDLFVATINRSLDSLQGYRAQRPTA